MTKIYILFAQDQHASAMPSRAGAVRDSSSKSKNPKPELVSGWGFLHVLLVILMMHVLLVILMMHVLLVVLDDTFVPEYISFRTCFEKT